jgi:DNA (cytosine-5)-methyltransferase 1
MAIHSELAIYKAAYDLLSVVVDAVSNMRRDAKPVIGGRLFLICTRSKAPVQLKLRRRRHIAAAEVIDFDAGKWTHIRRRGRSRNTLARIRSGRERFGDRFLAPYYGSGSGETGRSLDRPIGTITTRDRWAVIDGNRMRMVSIDESKAFMGFPKRYRLPVSKHEAMHMLGNAVPPPLARDVIAALRKAI